MSRPTVSVCMASYNGGRYIREQIDSIIPQLVDGDELLVSDDGSTDSTLQILADYEAEFPLVSILHGPRKGVLANFSSVLDKSRGEVVFLCDQDDVWHPDKVERVLATFLAHPGCGVVVHDARFIDAEGNPQDQTFYAYRGSRAGFAHNIAKNSYHGCCMAVSRDVLHKALPVPEGLEMHDWWIGLVAERAADPAFIDDELIGYRRHGDNVSEMHHHPVGQMVRNRVALLLALRKRRSELGGWGS